MSYRTTLAEIADRVDDEGLKALIIQLANDLTAEFEATTKVLISAIDELKLMTSDRHVTLAHKIDDTSSGVSHKVHNLANQVAVAMFKLDEIMEYITSQRD